MKYNIPDRVLKDIISMAKKCNIQKVILFGSRARGTHRERSDIDIAVSGGDFDEFYWMVNEEAWTLLMFDIVDLNKRISDELKKEIEGVGFGREILDNLILLLNLLGKVCRLYFKNILLQVLRQALQGIF